LILTFVLLHRRVSEWQGPLQSEKKGDLLKKLDQIISEASQLYGSNESILLWHLLKLAVMNDGVISQLEPKLRDFLLEDVGQAALFSNEQSTSSKSGPSEADEIHGSNLIMNDLMRGNKEEALRLAIERRMWPFALLISSRISKASYLGLVSTLSLFVFHV
jgi:hypothetical protein